MSALLHDWGKATVLFQQKLLSKNDQFKGDPLRHEWISCMLLNALVQSSGNTKSDEAWLKLLMNQTWDEELLKQTIIKNSDQSKVLDQLHLCSISCLVNCFASSPAEFKTEKEYKNMGVRIFHVSRIYLNLSKQIGVIKISLRKRVSTAPQLCFEFEQGLLTQSVEWTKQVKNGQRVYYKNLKYQNRFLLMVVGE